MLSCKQWACKVAIPASPWRVVGNGLQVGVLVTVLKTTLKMSPSPITQLKCCF